MGDVMTALLLALATENAELREQLASAQDMLVETAIDAGNMHALVEAMRTERDAWRGEAGRVRARAASCLSQSGVRRLRPIGWTG
ncbi:hypothetical protein MKK84_20205 [Methylobacterium sp. E-065]|uniref:hypothetical protein n=1 Tax=Methylobacterium sp. E-065 TaxID=2836583 RepID=UPI001FBA53C9|nr:hypothetical protein [Methylobacterium sp. E-065]MCJ2019732.1 hypothetical protein [Methylobacterium sp. E-065]